MTMPDRTYSSPDYRYGFNGFEKDNAVKSNGNHISFNGYGYDCRLGRRFQIDPVEQVSISSYAVFNNNPNYYVDPSGESPISVLAKMVAKKGAQAALKHYAKKQITGRLKKYMSKKMMKQFVKDLDDVVGILESSWLEIGIELIPVAGDLYGAGAFGVKVAKAWKKMQEIENKYVGKIEKSLSAKKRAKFKKRMRNAGVRDARKDQKHGVKNGKEYKGDGTVDGHHKKSVKDNPDLMADPSNIRFMDKKAHLRYHRWRRKFDKQRKAVKLAEVQIQINKQK